MQHRGARADAPEPASRRAFPGGNPAARHARPEDRLPIWTAVAIVAGVNVVLWLLIVLALKHLLF